MSEVIFYWFNSDLSALASFLIEFVLKIDFSILIIKKRHTMAIIAMFKG